MRSWQRWWPAMGIVFVVLFIVTFALVSDTGSTAAETAKKLPKHEARLTAAFVVGTISMMALLAFFGSLRELARAVAPERPVLSRLSFVPVAAAAALLPGSLAILAGAARAGHDATLSPALAQFAEDAQFPFLAAGAMFSGLAIFCASLALKGTGALPQWLCWAGVVVGVLLLASIAFVPMVLWLLWVLVASIVLLGRRPERAAPTTSSTV